MTRQLFRLRHADGTEDVFADVFAARLNARSGDMLLSPSGRALKIRIPERQQLPDEGPECRQCGGIVWFPGCGIDTGDDRVCDCSDEADHDA